MSADPRGPSGTGHDTACPKCGTPGAAYVTHVCMTAGEVPDPPATRWLNPPPDPPVAVPGPASAEPENERRDTGVYPCFAPCGQPACQKLGCIRVYNARHGGFVV